MYDPIDERERRTVFLLNPDAIEEKTPSVVIVNDCMISVLFA